MMTGGNARRAHKSKLLQMPPDPYGTCSAMAADYPAAGGRPALQTGDNQGDER